MSSFKVFQIDLSDEKYEKINETGTARKMQLDIYVAAREEESSAKSLVCEAFDRGFYDHVADIEARDLDAVFRIGNIGPEELITHHAPMLWLGQKQGYHTPMRSVSFGDVIEDDEGWRYVVVNGGFAPVAFNNAPQDDRKAV